MADIPLVCNFQGDYGFKVLIVDEESTIEQVISVAIELLAGVVVPPVSNRESFVVRVQDSEEPLNLQDTVKSAGLMSMETIEIYQSK